MEIQDTPPTPAPWHKKKPIVIILSVIGLVVVLSLAATFSGYLGARVAPGLRFKIGGSSTLTAGQMYTAIWDVSTEGVAKYPLEKLEVCFGKKPKVRCLVLASSVANNGKAVVKVPASLPAGGGFLKFTARDANGQLAGHLVSTRGVSIQKAKTVVADNVESGGGNGGGSSGSSGNNSTSSSQTTATATPALTPTPITTTTTTNATPTPASNTPTPTPVSAAPTLIFKKTTLVGTDGSFTGVELVWSTTNASSCVVPVGSEVGNWAGAKHVNGLEVVPASTTQITYAYRITCYNGSGQFITDSATGNDIRQSTANPTPTPVLNAYDQVAPTPTPIPVTAIAKFLEPLNTEQLILGDVFDVRVQLTGTDTGKLTCQEWILDGVRMTSSQWVAGQTPVLSATACQ